MTANAWWQILLPFALVLAAAWPLGRYMAAVMEGRSPLNRVLAPVERGLYRLAGISADDGMTWRPYTMAVFAFSLIGIVVVTAMQLLQGALPLNPQHFGAVPWHLALNTAISFVTNTNWQAYGGESSLSYLTQLGALTVQNFVSAATGLAVLAALARGIRAERGGSLGNFWADLVRGTLHILLPLSILLAVVLAGQGVVQSAASYTSVPFVEAQRDSTGAALTQTIAVGPAASQVAIKQLGTNGGGFFNANSAHPLENPTPLSNLLELVAIILIPAALCLTFGILVGAPRQGVALLAAMTVLLAPLTVAAVAAEQSGTPVLAAAGATQQATDAQAGGNMEGKETRFGIVNSAVWAAFTTAASNGSVNAMHDSFTPLGGLIPMWLMQLGEVVFGGVGSGLYGMVLFALVGVFIAGLMVGRTPEYLGKKIESFEMKMAMVAILAPSLVVLIGTAISVVTDPGKAGILNTGAHGFSEVLYGWSSTANNNGSAFGGLTANSLFYDLAFGAAMLIGRFGVLIPVLAIAGALATKQRVPAGPGTLPTDTPLFVGILCGTVVLVGALTFLPALALGPIVEHLQLTAPAVGVVP